MTNKRRSGMSWNPQGINRYDILSCRGRLGFALNRVTPDGFVTFAPFDGGDGYLVHMPMVNKVRDPGLYDAAVVAYILWQNYGRRMFRG